MKFPSIKPQVLKSGATVTSGETFYDPSTRTYGGHLLPGRSALAIVPMASVLDTSGASSASEVYRSQASVAKWTKTRAMTEAEFAEYRGATPIIPRTTLEQIPLNAPLKGTVSFEDLSRFKSNPRSYEEYLGMVNKPSAPSSLFSYPRLGIGGSSRSTGLGY